MSLDTSFRNNAPWGLARISTREKLANQDPFALTYQYQYDSQPGSGVDIYVVDTGLLFIIHSRYNNVSTSTSVGIYVEHVREHCSDCFSAMLTFSSLTSTAVLYGGAHSATDVK